MMNINMFSEQSYKKPADKSVVQYQVTSLNYLLLFRSNTLQPHRLQHPRLPCPSASPRACSNSCILSQWCHPTISSSVIPSSFCCQSFPASGFFLISQLFASGGQSMGALVSSSVLSRNIQSLFPLGLTVLISAQFKGLSRVFSKTTVQKHQRFGIQPFLWSKSHIHTWLLENHSFDYTDFGRQSNVSSFYFIFFNFIYFNWRLVTLQYCIGFAIHQHESAF